LAPLGDRWRRSGADRQAEAWCARRASRRIPRGPVPGWLDRGGTGQTVGLRLRRSTASLDSAAEGGREARPTMDDGAASAGSGDTRRASARQGRRPGRQLSGPGLAPTNNPLRRPARGPRPFPVTSRIPSPAVEVTGRLGHRSAGRSGHESPPDPLGWRTGRAVGSDPDAKAHERLPRAVGRPRGRVAVTAVPRRTVGAAKKIGPPGARTDGGGRSGGLGRPRSQAERRNFTPSPLTSSSVTTTPPATGRRQRTATDPW